MPVANVFTRSYYTDLGIKGGNSREEEKGPFYYHNKMKGLNLHESQGSIKAINKIIPQIGDVWQVNNDSYEYKIMLLYVRTDGWWECIDYGLALEDNDLYSYSKISPNFLQNNNNIKYTLIKRLEYVNESLDN